MSIRIAQISPFDYCNNKCWYCPVAYYPQPVEYIKHMSPELFEKVIKNLVEEKGKLVSENFDFIYTAHYNEIILYKYLKEMLETLRKYGVKVMLLSNGVSFTQDKLDIIKDYKDVIAGINFNTPSFGDDWGQLVGQPQELMIQVIENIRNTYKEFGAMVSVGMNSNEGVEVHKKVEYAKSLIPDMNIYPAIGLCDRAGLLVDKTILDNREEINRNKENKARIVGCRNGQRTTDWLHINSQGKVFLCCNDYFFTHEFGDLNTQEIKDIWMSDKHKQVIEQAFGGLCQKCSFAIWN